MYCLKFLLTDAFHISGGGLIWFRTDLEQVMSPVLSISVFEGVSNNRKQVPNSKVLYRKTEAIISNGSVPLISQKVTQSGARCSKRLSRAKVFLTRSLVTMYHPILLGDLALIPPLTWNALLTTQLKQRTEGHSMTSRSERIPCSATWLWYWIQQA